MVPLLALRFLGVLELWSDAKKRIITRLIMSISYSNPPLLHHSNCAGPLNAQGTSETWLLGYLQGAVTT